MRRKLLSVNISLILLASCCLVICTDESPDELSNRALISEQFTSRTALDKKAVGASHNEEDLIRISSELCAKFPHKCRSGELIWLRIGRRLTWWWWWW